MWKQFKKHWIFSVIASIVGVVGAIVLFLSGLAAIWPVFSHDTVPEFLQKKGWLITSSLSGPPWMTMALMAMALGILLLHAALWREAYAQHVYEIGRVDREELARTKADRDNLIKELRETKRFFARERLQMMGGVLIDGSIPMITIRYVGHGPDYALVEQIENIFRECTPRWKIVLDGSNVPALRPDPKLKVVFQRAYTGIFESLIGAFVTGQLLDVPMGWRHTDRSDLHHLVIEILPD